MYGRPDPSLHAVSRGPRGRSRDAVVRVIIGDDGEGPGLANHHCGRHQREKNEEGSPDAEVQGMAHRILP